MARPHNTGCNAVQLVEVWSVSHVSHIMSCLLHPFANSKGPKPGSLFNTFHLIGSTRIAHLTLRFSKMQKHATAVWTKYIQHISTLFHSFTHFNSCSSSFILTNTNGTPTPQAALLCQEDDQVNRKYHHCCCSFKKLRLVKPRCRWRTPQPSK